MSVENNNSLANELEKNFNHQEAEKRIYEWWEKSGFFKADPKAPGEAFCIVMPPPNVTGNLHMGHALDSTLQDVLTRHHRMLGHNVLWLPGTDHAGIATQNVVERSLAAEGLSREELGREEFIKRVWEWKKLYGDNIVRQLRRLGASCDWSRERFSLDEGLSEAVNEVFVRLYEEGLIYQGDYIVNWCPRCLTAIADIEVEHEEKEQHLYHLKYYFENSDEYLTVATTRPETIFGDVAIAVNPDDPKMSVHIGRKAIVPLVGRAIDIIGDSYVDMNYGSGALKVTPAHDVNDFQIGQRHNLPAIKCFDQHGVLNEQAGKYCGLDRFEAREIVINDLQEASLMSLIEPLKHSVGGCYRCRTVIEPYLSHQWFIKTKPLAEKALEAVKCGDTKFVPQNWEKTYFDWMENIRDWCISRQLWWGHQIPAWHCPECQKTIVSRTEPDKCPDCQSDLIRDPDVLDTWFSSGLWAFSTLGWPQDTADLRRYYPTSVLVTGFDIIFFWVARMMMMGLHFMDQVPFKTILIHALVRDASGQKMSKSKGNVIDPLTIIDQYGADAFRFTLCALSGQGRDIKLSNDRIAGYSKFVNKIWNAAKFTLLNTKGVDLEQNPPRSSSLPDRWIISRLDTVAKEIKTHLELFHFDKLADTLYQFIWTEFCDWYLELIKPILYGEESVKKLSCQKTLLYVWSSIIKLLHPVMPFVSEELWSKIQNDSIMKVSYPLLNKKSYFDQEAENKINFIMDITKAVRQVRSDFRVPPAIKLTPKVKLDDSNLQDVLREYSPLLLKLIGAESLLLVDENEVKSNETALNVFSWGQVWTPLTGHIDVEAEKIRLNKDLEKTNKDIASAQARLANEDYLKKAPEELVQETKDRLVELQKRIQSLENSLKLIDEMA